MNQLTHKSLLCVALATAFLSSACVAHVRPAPGRHHPHAAHRHSEARVVVIKKGHVHSHSCGHYRHEGRWYRLSKHVHAKHCGHARVRGVWVLKK